MLSILCGIWVLFLILELIVQAHSPTRWTCGVDSLCIKIQWKRCCGKFSCCRRQFWKMAGGYVNISWKLIHKKLPSNLWSKYLDKSSNYVLPRVWFLRKCEFCFYFISIALPICQWLWHVVRNFLVRKNTRQHMFSVQRQQPWVLILQTSG